MNKAKKFIFLGAIIFTLMFVISFFAFDNYLNKRKNIDEETNQTTMANDKNNVLNEKIKITLYKGDSKEKEGTLKDMKKDLGLDGDVTQETLSKSLEKQGYKLDTVYDDEISYKRSVESAVEPNKYYIKQYEEYFTVFASDSEGNLILSNPQIDMHLNEKKKLKDLPKSDQDIINKLELKFDTKDEAEEKLSELIS
ncbi:hypothetical protein NNC19_01975 [Clostridium sp. SHJSY1]|uniref:hypothetical protein n=1 Tax=Clostridium sp. SHJSY1 TaxID=2942483 RepID=UPI00287605BE|nr:hypothetical protein [Clostridium sp. SHJSY1]MDS0524427.1 hypothetical protein [Clostridium sp. SHJSY1]